MKEEQDNSWARQERYGDKDGREIIKYSVIDDDGEFTGENLYKGRVLLTVRSQDPRQPPHQMPFEFDFEKSKSFEWIRANYDLVAEKAVREFEKEQQKSQAMARKEIVPSMGNKPILGADGRPVLGVV